MIFLFYLFDFLTHADLCLWYSTSFELQAADYQQPRR